MNILVMAYSCEPNKGSEPNRSWNHISILAQRHRVDVVTHPRGRAGIESVPPLPGVTFHYVDVGPLLDPWKKFRGEILGSVRYTLWQIAALRLAKRLEEKIHFDVVIQLSFASLTAPQFACFIGPPLVWGPIGGGHKFPYAMVSFLRYRFLWEMVRNIRVEAARWTPWVRASARRARIVLVTNPETEAVAVACGGRDVRLVNDVVLPDSWSVKAPSIKPEENRYTVVWVGRLEEHKAPLLALHAILRARESVPVQLVVIGEGPMRSACQTYINAHNMQTFVTLTGQISHPEVRQHVRNAALLLFTSLRDSLPPAPFEALSQGTPVVMLDLHGAVHVPNEASVKVPVTTPDEIAGRLALAMTDLLTSPDKLRKMGTEGESFARRTLWPGETSILIQAIEAIQSAVGAANLEPSGVES